MRKKMYQIISFVMAFLLAISSIDMSVLAEEISTAEYEKEQTSDESEEDAETSKEEEENSEISRLEMTETQAEEILIEEAKTDNPKGEEISTEFILEITSTENKEISTETISTNETELENETKSSIDDSENTSDHMKINIGEKIILANDYTIKNSSLKDLLNSYFALLSYDIIEYDKELLLKCMSQEVFDNTLRRLATLDEKQIRINNVSYEVTEYNEKSGELLIKVSETINGSIIESLHIISVSNNNNLDWRVENDSYDDTDISGIRTDGKEISLYSFSNGYPNTWVNTGDQAKDITQIALTQVGYSETGENHTKYNYWFYTNKDTPNPWCAIFVSWCANQAGIPTSVIKKNAWVGFPISNVSNNDFGVPAYSFSSTTAKVGDLAFINNDTDAKIDHVGLIYAVDSNYIYTVEGNYSDKVSKCKYSASTGCMVSPKNTSATSIMFYGRPNYANSSQNNSSPIGHLDGIEGGKGTVTAIGWAVDPDNYSKDVDIHIYIGGNIGVGSLYSVTANNESRSDVKSEHPNVKENCGFNYTFKVNERGTQEVYVYALDTQGYSTNTLIGHTTITIANPDPVIRIDPDSLQLNVNDTKALTVSYEISGTYNLDFRIADTNIITAKWGTPANGKCDLSIKGLKKGSTSIDISLWDETMTTLIYNETIPITVTELSVEFSEGIVETNENETKTFEFRFSGSDLYGMECEIGDRSIVDLTGWEWDKNNEGTIKVQGYKEGKTDLTVYLIGVNNTVLFSQSIPIIVIKPSASFGQNNMDINVNETQEITFSFQGANLQDLGLDIADQSIATLEGWEWNANNNGIIKIKGQKTGSTTMTLYLVGADGSRICSKSIPISVKESLSGITLNAYTKELTVGSSFQLIISYMPSTAKPTGIVQWSSSNTSVAIVDAHGRVKGLAKGTTVITASVDGFQKECKITVVEDQVPVTGIFLNADNIFLKERMKYVLTANYTPSNANTNIPSASDIVWNSQNTKIATVSNGVVTAVSSGSTTITAKYGNYSAACKVTVTENEEESSKVEESPDIVTSSENSSEKSSTPEKESVPEKASDPERNTETEEAAESEKDTETKETSETKDSTETEEAPETENNTESDDSSETEKGDEITDKISIKPIQDMVYTGKALKPELEVYIGSKKLYLNTDYTVSYKNNTAVGIASVIVKGKGNYSEKTTSYFNIVPKDLSDPDVITEDLALAANHKVQKKVPVVSYNGKKLKVNKDFIASFGNGDFKEEGTYTVTLTGIKNFTGSVQAKIIITDKKNLIKNAKVTYQSSQPYTGKEITPPVSVMCNNTLLTSNQDYTVSYINNIKPGKATIVIVGKGKYAGTKIVSFTIKKACTILTEQMVNITSSTAYVKGGCFPKPSVACNGETLVMGKDYTVSYKNNKSVGIATIRINGKGAYSGTIEKSFEIKQKNINDISVRVPDIVYNESTGKYISTPILMDSDGNMLKLNKDFGNVTYSINGTQLNNQSKPALGSTITVTLSGIGSYTGTVTRTYELKNVDFSKVNVSKIEKIYTGDVVTIKPSDLQITLNGETLVYGKDYDIVKGTYKNNTKKGQASVVIKGLGKYAGEKTVKFRIIAKPIN